MPFKGGKTWGARAGGRQSHPPPVWKRSEGPSNQPRSQRRGSPAGEVSDENVYFSFHIPTLSCYGPALLFLHALALLDSCEGLRRLLAAHGIPLHLSAACWACCRAGRVATSLPPTRHRLAPPLQSDGLGNDSPTPKTSRSFSKSLPQCWHTHPQLSVTTTTCLDIVDIPKGLWFSNNILPGSRFFQRRPHSHCPPLKKGTWAAALKIAP